MLIGAWFFTRRKRFRTGGNVTTHATANDILPWLQLSRQHYRAALQRPHQCRFRARRWPLFGAIALSLPPAIGNILARRVAARSSGRDPECGGRGWSRTNLYGFSVRRSHPLSYPSSSGAVNPSTTPVIIHSHYPRTRGMIYTNPEGYVRILD